MKSIAVTLACALMAALGLVSPVAAEAESSAVQLRGVSVFKTSRTASSLIRFPASTTAADLEWELSGKGRIYGYVMRQVGVPEEEAAESQVIAMERCTEAGCEAGKAYPNEVAFGSPAGGLWRLYVIADGAPVTIKLSLEGVAGAVTVRPRDRVNHELLTLEPRVASASGGNVYSAGAYTTLPRAPDYGVVQLWREGTGHYASAYRECYYYSLLPSPPEETAFLPGCPTSMGSDDTRVIQGDGNRGGPWFRFASFGEITGLGGWYTTTAAPEKLGATVFWLSYIDE